VHGRSAATADVDGQETAAMTSSMTSSPSSSAAAAGVLDDDKDDAAVTQTDDVSQTQSYDSRQLMSDKVRPQTVSYLRSLISVYFRLQVSELVSTAFQLEVCRYFCKHNAASCPSKLVLCSITVSPTFTSILSFLEFPDILAHIFTKITQRNIFHCAVRCNACQ